MLIGYSNRTESERERERAQVCVCVFACVCVRACLCSYCSTGFRALLALSLACCRCALNAALISAVSFSCKFAGASVGSADWQSARNGETAKPGESSLLLFLCSRLIAILCSILRRARAPSSGDTTTDPRRRRVSVCVYECVCVFA